MEIRTDRRFPPTFRHAYGDLSGQARRSPVCQFLLSRGAPPAKLWLILSEVPRVATIAGGAIVLVTLVRHLGRDVRVKPSER